MLRPQKSSSYTFSVSLFQLKFNSFPSSKILGPFCSGHAWLSALTLIVTAQLVTAYPGACRTICHKYHHRQKITTISIESVLFVPIETH